MFIPIKCQKSRVIGVIEIKNMNNQLFAFDEEYFGICLANFCNKAILKCIKTQIYKEEIKMKDFFYDAHISLCNSLDYFDFTKRV